MIIGTPKEIKNHEYRVGLTPAGVRELTGLGHQVLIEASAGEGVGFADADYISAGASIVDVETLFREAELIVKVKEPQPEECRRLNPSQTLFTYLHLAADATQTALLLESGVSAVAYETVTDERGALPLLAPMSEVAGRLSIQEGAHHLEKAQGGAGVLLGGVAGVAAAKVLVIGGGVVGDSAAMMAIGLGADVTIVDRSLPRLKQLDEMYRGRIKTVFSTAESIESLASQADLVIGGVLIPGAAAPKLLTRAMVGKMKKGSVVVDVAIDQGGCFETSKPTSHQSPTYEVDGVIHYCVTNMPGAVARTSTLALTNATLSYVMELAQKGCVTALRENEHLRKGLNIHHGQVTCAQVAGSLGYDAIDSLEALNLSVSGVDKLANGKDVAMSSKLHS